MSGLRIAFLTNEFVSEPGGGGGLGSYLGRMTHALLEQGHRPEVFVISRENPSEIDRDGVKVHRVRRSNRRGVLAMVRAIGVIPGLRLLREIAQEYRGPIALSKALADAEKVCPFDVVQSADWLAPGLLLPKKAGRRHLLRCSLASDLYNQVDGNDGWMDSWRFRMQQRAIRRADIVYAPSEFVAHHYSKKYRMNVQVLRPPMTFDHSIASTENISLPDRYLFHFGQLRKRKGTGVLLDALVHAIKQEPSVCVVMAGRLTEPDWDQWKSQRAIVGKQLRYLGPLPKTDLYGVLNGALATIVPSLVDNLPNSAIESLMLGIPVIGSKGASVDELVEPGVSGELVPVGDSIALGDMMVRLWRGQVLAKKGQITSKLASQMEPAEAVRRFLKLAGCATG